jgi:hypothetical protein
MRYHRYDCRNRQVQWVDLDIVLRRSVYTKPIATSRRGVKAECISLWMAVYGTHGGLLIGASCTIVINDIIVY